MLPPHLLQTQRRISQHWLWLIISATCPNSPSRFKRPSNLGHILLSTATTLKHPQLFAAAPRHLFPPYVTLLKLSCKRHNCKATRTTMVVLHHPPICTALTVLT